MSTISIFTRTINGQQISYMDTGYNAEGKDISVAFFPGMCQDSRGFEDLHEILSQNMRVISLNWRGHGPNRDDVSPFGVAEQFIPVSHSHGAWAAMDVAERVGKERVPAVVLLDLIMTEPTPEFAGAMAMFNNEASVKTGLAILIRSWVASTTSKKVLDYMRVAMNGFPMKTWMFLGQEVTRMYEKWGGPFKRLEKIQDPPQVRHLFSHSKDQAYRKVHQEYEAKHPGWFSWRFLDGESHFPGVELPEAVAQQVKEVRDKL